VHTAHNDNFILRKHIDDAVGETPQYRPPRPPSNSLILLWIVLDGRYRYVDRAEKLSTEANTLRFIPKGGICDFRARLQSENKSFHL
jgi:hypothetical protein